MKRYAVSVVLHILFLVIFSVSGYVLFQYQLWFSMLSVLLLLVATGIHLYMLQMKHITLMRRLAGGIRYDDLSQTIHAPFKDKVVMELSEELSQALSTFRKRLLNDEIKHQYYENLLNKVDTAVLVTDKVGHIEWMNQSAVSLLGPLSLLPEKVQAVPSDDNRLISIQRNGATLEMAVSSTHFVSQNRERMLISLKNIHSVLERNEMEAWQKLIRVLTHEIMNSITPIISLSETLSERTISPELGEKEYKIMLQAMETIHRRSKGLLDFVENYRRLTRIPSPVLSSVSVRDLFSDLRKLFPDPFIRIELPIREIYIRADRGQIEQVLINLIKNATEACGRKDSPKIDIKMRLDGNQKQFIVQDNGDGILPEVMDKVFVPFFTTKPTGSGIGLSLCKQIMSLHRGTITVQSETGKGSCFMLTFPAS